jgi:hypothetical protein
MREPLPQSIGNLRVCGTLTCRHQKVTSCPPCACVEAPAAQRATLVVSPQIASWCKSSSSVQHPACLSLLYQSPQTVCQRDFLEERQDQ